MFGVLKDSEVVYQEAVYVSVTSNNEKVTMEESYVSRSSSSKRFGSPHAFLRPFTPYQNLCLKVLYNNSCSSPLKPDRSSCGPGPPSSPLGAFLPGPMSKSYSVDDSAMCIGSNCNGSSAHPRIRQRSSSGHGPKKNSGRTTEDVLKRSRVQAGYELSQDLLDKQIEMLERKYGGVRARHAALTIQRAFRRYTLLKKFAAITAMAKAENKRLSRRLLVDLDLERMSGITMPPVTTSIESSTMIPGLDIDPEVVIRNNFASLYRELNVTLDPTSPTASPAITPQDKGRTSRGTGDNEGHMATSPMIANQQSQRLEVEMSSQNDITAGNASKIRHNTTSPGGFCSSPRTLSGDPESDLSDREMPSYSAFEESSVYYTPNVLTPCRNGTKENSPCTRHLTNGTTHSADSSLYGTPNMEECGITATNQFLSTSVRQEAVYEAVGPPSSCRTTTWRDAWATPPQAELYYRTSNSGGRKLPPEVPRRTSSMASRSMSTECHWQHEVSETRIMEEYHHHSHHHRQQQHHYEIERDHVQYSGQQLYSPVTPGPMYVRCPAGHNHPISARVLGKSVDSKGSLSSVQSSSSDSSSVSTGDNNSASSIEGVRQQPVGRTSPVWKRKGQHQQQSSVDIASTPTSKPEVRKIQSDHRRPREPVQPREPVPPREPIYQNTRPVAAVSNESVPNNYPQNHMCQMPLRVRPEPQTVIIKVPEIVRKRQYRVGLNLFNKKPEKGVSYLIQRGFLENSPAAVARFLITRKGLSKQMIGEYLGNLQSNFNMTVLDCFAQELDMSRIEIDVALRKFQTYFRMPGEAQKIERLMEVFGQRYCHCNPEVVSKFRSPDTVFVLAFAIIMLNTDLHTPNIKEEKRMKVEEFVKNLRGIDDAADIEREVVVGIYERIKLNEFKPGSDHVTQVMKVQQTIVGKKPNLALPHRRLVCYCRLYEIPDIGKKERSGSHQREVFLFNDLLVITKIFSKKKSMVTYTFRQHFSLCGMAVTLFEVPYYQYGIHLSQRGDNKILVTFNARNEHDRSKFVEDLRESIFEMDEMENLRIEAELEKQKSSRTRTSENRDSGVADVEVLPTSNNTTNKECSTGKEKSTIDASGLKRSALSNSLLDIHDQSDKAQRRGSVGSLDSGMSVSFQSTSASSISRDSSPQNVQTNNTTQCDINKGVTDTKSNHLQSVLGGLFTKKDRKVITGISPNIAQASGSNSTSTEV